MCEYIRKMKIAFNCFLGNNHLHQIIYNPCTGGCYDGLEDTYINLNQGAKPTVSNLLARLTIEKHPNIFQTAYFKYNSKRILFKIKPQKNIGLMSEYCKMKVKL